MTAPLPDAVGVVLLRCPFCGGRPHIREAMGETWVVCGSCNSSANSKSRSSQAVDLWNRRAQSQAARIAELEVDAARYRYLRGRDAGPEGQLPPAGVFIGQVPQNLILTEEDADEAIDQARSLLSEGEGADG